MLIRELGIGSAEHNVISFINIKRKFICCEPVINTFQLSVCDLKLSLIAVFPEKQICIISKHYGLTFSLGLPYFHYSQGGQVLLGSSRPKMYNFSPKIK